MSIHTEVNKSRPLIVFGEDWGGHPSSTQHLIKELNQHRKVIWINSIGLRKPKLTWRDFYRVVKKLTSFIRPKKENSKLAEINQCRNFTVISPLVVPCANSWFSVKISKWMLARQIRKAVISLDIKDPIVWCSLPTAVDYISLFENSISVYYCGDDFGSLAGVDHAVVLKKEQLLVNKVKYVFTASEALLSKFPKEKAVIVPHGVNFPLFNNKQREMPDDLPRGGFIAGFYGSISTWIDQDLILSAARSLPSWNFVFIGNVECNIDALLGVPNIYFLEAKQHYELPNYIQHWSVALLPFINNKQIQMCNPLKLREYLASGTPVVSTKFNAVAAYEDHVKIIGDKEDIAQAILLANAEVTTKMNFDSIVHINDLLAITSVKKVRTNSVISESWQNRADKIDNYLIGC